MFNKSALSFEAREPKISQELGEWQKDGLIPPFNGGSMAADVLVNVLQAVRKHINEEFNDQNFD